jgi:hypothetical protein
MNGITFNVDPRLVVAIAGAETTFGRNYVTCPATGFNAWSWFWPNITNCAADGFSSYAVGIQNVTHQMRLYFNRGLTTIPTIGKTYCTRGCGSWVSLVTSFYAQLGGDTIDLKYITLNGSWAGNAIFNDGSGPETVPISASFTVTPDSITGTVVFTEPNDSADVNTLTYQVTGPSSFTLNSTNVNATGSVTVTSSNGQAQLSGTGSDNEQSSGTGTLNFVVSHAPSDVGSLLLQAKTTITDPDDGTSTGTGSLKISSDQTQISGTAQNSDGSTVSWSATKQ